MLIVWFCYLIYDLIWSMNHIVNLTRQLVPVFCIFNFFLQSHKDSVWKKSTVVWYPAEETCHRKWQKLPKGVSWYCALVVHFHKQINSGLKYHKLMSTQWVWAWGIAELFQGEPELTLSSDYICDVKDLIKPALEMLHLQVLALE